MNLDDDWESFLQQDIDDYNNGIKKEEITIEEKKDNDNNLLNYKKENNIECTPIYISTTTKIGYLNQEIDIYNLYWDIPVINYDNPLKGVIKKQIKLTTYSNEETEEINEKLKEYKYIKKHTISILDNPKSKAKINYKHVQKISIGISKKDFINYRSKEKGAFYNCFALVIRLMFEGEFKEVHVKVFNTGKLEIPGIKNIKLLYKTLELLVEIMKPYIKDDLKYIESSIETVLINSNFSCGFYVNREKLYELLKFKYNMISMYDPCSYPGIQSKFYHNHNKLVQNGICECETKCNKKGNGNGKGQCHEVSFMIFRTGSVLIVGRCDEPILYEIYEFLKNILEEEFTNIFDEIYIKNNKKKVLKKAKKIQITIEDKK
jgi:TATA-box binding protein (TBP) (component of TFIID and TFIIIB)